MALFSYSRVKGDTTCDKLKLGDVILVHKKIVDFMKGVTNKISHRKGIRKAHISG